MNRKGDLNHMNHTRVAGLMLCALLLLPPNAVAAETTALAANVQGETTQGETIKPFGPDRSYRGVSASDEWMAQARIGGLMLNLRLFTPEGDFVSFQENLSRASSDPDFLRLTLLASQWDEDLILQLDQQAMNALHRVGVIELVIVDHQYAVRARYFVSELQQIRDYFDLAYGEQLCLSGEDSPVTVVGEDGYRRQITQ